MHGTLFLVVGPSGVGKDTLLGGACDTLEGAWFRFPRRMITRPADAGGEDHKAVTEAEFDDLLAQGAFLHYWSAHGLRYGIPADIAQNISDGINVVVNTSRGEVDAIRAKVPNTLTVSILASPEVVAERLRARGRETEYEIARRLSRIIEEPVYGVDTLKVLNDGTVEEGIEKLINVIAGSSDLCAGSVAFPVDFGARAICVLNTKNPVAARVLVGTERVSLSANKDTLTADLGWTDDETLVPCESCAVSESILGRLGIERGTTLSIERAPVPESRSILQKKVRGSHLDPKEVQSIVEDLVNGRFSNSEIAGFLVSAARNLTIDEVIELTKARAAYSHQQKWDADIVVDKHSMGGIPGNRISPIIISILAAFGLTMPKTSSRAITSAAGTADMMEVLAKVDLTPQEMQQVVRQTGACIAWNGRLTHSPIDDVMNAINRPLGLASAMLDVSSIMSKKLAAGSTHVLIDLPIGPQAKTKTQKEGEELKHLFETVGAGVGLKVHGKLTDGTKPIGRGIGPILETIDVLNVLSNTSNASQDLLEKSLDYSAHILEWTEAVKAGQGLFISRQIIENGQAFDKFQEILTAQGRNVIDLKPSLFTKELTADRSGKIELLDTRVLSAIARVAGAPQDKSAGIYLSKQVGEFVEKGEPLIRVHASSQQVLEEALAVVETTLPIVSDWS